MTSSQQFLDPERVRRLFDLASNVQGWNGGQYGADPYPVWAALREQAPVHPGTVHALSGVEGVLISTDCRIRITRTFRPSRGLRVTPPIAIQRRLPRRVKRSTWRMGPQA